MIEWLGFHASTAGDMRLIPDQGAKAAQCDACLLARALSLSMCVCVCVCIYLSIYLSIYIYK